MTCQSGVTIWNTDGSDPEVPFYYRGWYEPSKLRDEACCMANLILYNLIRHNVAQTLFVPALCAIDALLCFTVRRSLWVNSPA